MALLTEQQIDDILGMVEVHASSFCGRRLIKWNEDQVRENFPIPWHDAPVGTTDVEINLRFGDENGEHEGFEEPVYIKIPTRFFKPRSHRHAALMLKYAEVAARRPDPWMEFGYYHKGKIERFCEEIKFYATDDYEFLGEEK